ncbi:MAG: polysaccharide biosynthesis C-terminal domain-containing protein [Planctomycetes bacterium]|nr:polysaccharide biosynthesis C-terminal domain-containing protein [Planctomycetota bacterium]
MAQSQVATGRRPFVLDAVVLLGNRFIVMALTVVTGAVLARCLGPGGRGSLAAVLVYPTLFSTLTEVGVRQSATYYLGKRIFSDQQVVGAVCSLILLTGLLGMIGVAGLMAAIGNPGFTPVIIALATASIPLTVVKNYSAGILLGKRLVGVFATVQRMAVVQRLVIVILLVWWLALGVVGALLATLLSGLLITGYGAWRVSQIASIRPRAEWEVIRALLTKGVVYAAGLFVLTLNYKIDIALMERLTSASEIGLYTVAVGLAELTWALPQSISTALFSHSAGARDEKAFSHKLARLLRVTVISSLLVVVVLAIASPVLIPAMYGAEFGASVIALYLLLPGVFWLMIFKVLAMDLAGRGRPAVSMWVTVPGLLVNIALNMCLLPRYGARGAAVASSVSYSLMGVGFMFLYCGVTGMGLGELWRYRKSDFAFLKRVGPRVRSWLPGSNRFRRRSKEGPSNGVTDRGQHQG